MRTKTLAIIAIFSCASLFLIFHNSFLGESQGEEFTQERVAPPMEKKPIDRPYFSNEAETPHTEDRRPVTSAEKPSAAFGKVPENVGALLQRALDGGTALESFEALNHIDTCGRLSELQENILKFRSESSKAANNPEVIAELLTRMQAAQRNCQTLVPISTDQRKLLAIKALDGLVVGSANHYLRAVNYRVEPARLSQVVNALKLDVLYGDSAAAFSLATSGADWEIPDMQRRAYELVYSALEEQQGRKAFDIKRHLPGKSIRVTEQEEMQANAAANEILSDIKGRQLKP